MTTPPTALPAPSRGPANPVRTWLRAIRIFSFTASITPILVGSALALLDGHIDGPREVALVVAMLLASVAVHAGCNLGNDYYDYRRGIDADVGTGSDPRTTGPAGVIQDRSLTPEQVFRGMIVAFALATVIGIVIVLATGWPILVLALICLALAFLYTGGPKPLGYIALGEVTVFVTMGLAMIQGSYYVLSGEVNWRSFGVALPLALLVTAILHGNNIADMATDRAAGKITVANALGRRAANIEYVALVAGAWVAVAVLVLLQRDLWPLLLTFAAIPAGAGVIGLYLTGTERPALRYGVRRSAGLHLRFGLLMVAGLLIATGVDRWL
ncbi:MAG TPA: 1,4-dihydroxy-2-naphthoate octaprenyltransferase [Thermomicrobiales bacterium]|jgi:1,4-dihydroxy-2-naphthoate octaprenyltransferase|nr:1,4-dihydroxy-2-naphthoate octaprenyltransferase [Thermomicrobiales bacterium]